MDVMLLYNLSIALYSGLLKAVAPWNKKAKQWVVGRKNISRTFSGFVMSIVGSVHFWLVPWSDLYFSRSIGPFLCSWY